MKARGIGNSYWGYGTGTVVDVDKAIFWYERAIFLDPDELTYNAQTTYRLSQVYRYKGDINKSIDYLKQSASLGWIFAEEALGKAYLYGDDVSKDPSQGKKWLKKAHNHGSLIAEHIYCNSLPKAQQKACKF